MLSLMTIFISVTASSQVQYIKATSGKLIPYGRISTLTTTNATPVIVDVLTIADNSAGVIEVTVSGSSAAGDGVTGRLIYRYKKVSGTLTIATADTVSTITVDSNVSGAGFALAADGSNNAKLTLTGKSSVTIKWRAVIKPFFNQ